MPNRSGRARAMARGKTALALGAVFALSASLLQFASPAQAEDPDTIAQITDGSVVWGYKESWRNYIGKNGTELSGGVTWTEDDLYEFPVESGSFDEATNTLHLDLAGSIHFRAYCDAGLCQLDSQMEDLSVEISEEHQVIRGTYIGRPQDDPGGDFERQENVLFGVIDVFDAEPALADGMTTWTQLPVLGGGGALYGAGTVLDPVTITYRGPGGKPDLEERWDAEGAPVFAPGAEFQPSATTLRSSYRDRTPSVRISETAELLVVTEFLGNGADGKARYVFRGLDPVTLEEIGSTEFAADNTTYLQTAFDPKRNTVFFISSQNNFPAASTFSVRSATWDPASSSFQIEEVGSVDGGDYMVGGVLAWNEVTNELVWSALRLDGDADYRTDHTLHSFTRGDEGWTDTARGVVLPGIILESSISNAMTFFGTQNATLRKDDGYLVQPDGSIILAVGGSFIDAGGATHQRPLVRLSREAGAGDWNAEFIEGSVAVNGDNVQPFNAVTRAADGSSILAFAGGGAGVIQYIQLDGGTVVSAETVDPVPGSGQRTGSNLAVDRALGFEYALADTIRKATAVVDRRGIATFDMPNGLVSGSVFAVTNDSAIITTVAETTIPNASTFIRRYDLIGTTPIVTAQPEGAAVSLTQGALTASAAFSVGHEDEGDTTVQWQRKLPGQSRFQYVDGADGAEYAPEVGLELNGAEYRAVLSNDVGTVVSDAATLSVVSAPRFAAQPVDLAVYDGDTARFTAPISDEVAGEQRWERLVDEQWITIENDEVLTVDGGTLSVVASDAVNGAIFRSVLSNEVGENVSSEVTLSVQQRTVIPEEGLAYSGVGFEWDFSDEMQAAPPFGGANHFSAGVSDGTESTYRAESGNVKIVHSAADGTRSDVAYASRSAFIDSGARQLVTLSNGSATVMPDGSATVAWKGSFSVNMYGGLVPFAITDPVLTVAPDATGALTGSLGGYAGEIANPSSKTPLEPVDGVTIATFSEVEVDTLNGFTVSPHYGGVEVEIPAGYTPQQRSGDGWGAWPQSFVDFQLATGLSSYWYTSGSTFDPKKAPNAFLVDFRGAEPVVAGAPVVSSQPVGVSVVEGASASFSAAASGSPEPSVQWESKRGSGAWAPVAGATSETLQLSKVSLSLSGTQYRAVFTNSAGSATSDAATLTVTAKPVDPKPKPLPFTDVVKGDKFYKEIDWMFQNGLTTGVKQADGSVRYEPKAGVSREAMAAFLYRLEGSPRFSAPKVSPFADLKPSDKFYKEITWLAEQGITTGVRQSSGKPKFLPKDRISREAMAAFMYRYEGKPKYQAPRVSAFKDLKPSDKFYREIHWMKDAGITTGVKQPSGKPAFQPKSSVTREAMAAFIYRLEN